MWDTDSETVAEIVRLANKGLDAGQIAERMDGQLSGDCEEVEEVLRGQYRAVVEGTTPTLDRLVSEGIVWWDTDINGYVGRADDGVLVTFGVGGEGTEMYLAARPTKDLW